MTDPVEKNPWGELSAFTNARIALGRAGNSLPTAPLLAFNLSHAQARDAVHQPLDVEALHRALHDAGFASLDVESAAPDRQHYLRRPDLGRRLSDASRERLARMGGGGAAGADGVRDASRVSSVSDVGSMGCANCANGANSDAISDAISADNKPPEIVFVIGDGLSAFAAAKQVLPLLMAMRKRLDGWRVGPIVVARQARVALGDEIGELLRAQLVAMLIGERPGLSSPDSLGVYLTYAPKLGCHDALRNCISNVRPEGLSHEAAAHKLHYLMTQARRLGLTGVGLKDDSDALLPDAQAARLGAQ